MSTVLDFIIPGALVVLAVAGVARAIRETSPARLRAMREPDPGYRDVRQAVSAGPRGRVPVTCPSLLTGAA